MLSPAYTNLIESRLQLHYAIQFIAAVGAALGTPQPDYSHTSLSWNSQLKLFVGSIIYAEQPFQIALDPVRLTSLVLDQTGTTLAELPLHQKTLAAGMNWLKQEITQLGADASKVALLPYPPDDFPDHAIAHNAPFDQAHPALRQTLVNYYDITQTLLQEIISTVEGASPIHIWPHHFDMATLITLPQQTTDAATEEARSIGIGLSPGDTSYNEPYWYVSPYPYPDTTQLPSLAGNGFWHTSHWVGAVLTASRLIEHGSDEAVGEQVRTFLRSAIGISQQIL